VGFVVDKVVLGQVSPANSHFADCSILVSIILGWYSSTDSGRRTKWTQFSHPTPRNLSGLCVCVCVREREGGERLFLVVVRWTAGSVEAAGKCRR
jgi:hypothetical protein